MYKNHVSRIVLSIIKIVWGILRNCNRLFFSRMSICFIALLTFDSMTFWQNEVKWEWYFWTKYGKIILIFFSLSHDMNWNDSLIDRENFTTYLSNFFFLVLFFPFFPLFPNLYIFSSVVFPFLILVCFFFFVWSFLSHVKWS